MWGDGRGARFRRALWRRGWVLDRILHCGGRPVCEEFLIFGTSERVRTSAGPVRATDMAPLAGMVMRGSRPHLQERARGSSKVSGLSEPDRVDHVSIPIMPSSQSEGPVVHSMPDQGRSAPAHDSFHARQHRPDAALPSCSPVRRPRQESACVPASGPATAPSVSTARGPADYGGCPDHEHLPDVPVRRPVAATPWRTAAEYAARTGRHQKRACRITRTTHQRT
jgi:hypothetical protein